MRWRPILLREMGTSLKVRSLKVTKFFHSHTPQITNEKSQKRGDATDTFAQIKLRSGQWSLGSMLIGSFPGWGWAWWRFYPLSQMLTLSYPSPGKPRNLNMLGWQKRGRCLGRQFSYSSPLRQIEKGICLFIFAGQSWGLKFNPELVFIYTVSLQNGPDLE